jgi:hypothetical protein
VFLDRGGKRALLVLGIDEADEGACSAPCGRLQAKP